MTFTNLLLPLSRHIIAKVIHYNGGGKAASVVNTGAANATEATWECPLRFLPLPLSLPLRLEPLELHCLCCCWFGFLGPACVCERSCWAKRGLPRFHFTVESLFAVAWEEADLCCPLLVSVSYCAITDERTSTKVTSSMSLVVMTIGTRCSHLLGSTAKATRPWRVLCRVRTSDLPLIWVDFRRPKAAERQSNCGAGCWLGFMQKEKISLKSL